MTRILLIGVLLAFLFWALRNFLDKVLHGARPSARTPLKRHKEGRDRKPVDLVRDEKTGEYRVKED